jgi:hypothetical protein
MQQSCDCQRKSISQKNRESWTDEPVESNQHRLLLHEISYNSIEFNEGSTTIIDYFDDRSDHCYQNY